MVQMRWSWVRKAACPTDLTGGRCIQDDEILTHHTSERGKYINAPRPALPEEEVSLMRGALTKAEACRQRIGGSPPAPTDVARAGIRYAEAGELRKAGFAVVHTCGKKGESNGHVSVVWPDDNPLDNQESEWPLPVQKAFAACFTEHEG